MTSYDTIIIGAGLSGLWLSYRLRAHGDKVALLEARETLGGRYRRQNSQQPYGPPSLEFYPADDAVSGFTAVDARSSADAAADRDHRAPPRLYDEGKWRDFVGFGENALQLDRSTGDFQPDARGGRHAGTRTIGARPGRAIAARGADHERSDRDHRRRRRTNRSHQQRRTRRFAPRV